MRLLKRFYTLTAILGMARCLVAAAAFPYPYNGSYAFGYKPAPFGASAAADAATILNKYNSWKASHVVPAGAGKLRVQRDSADGNDTVSEGISYGMLLAVYFNDQSTFDQLWAYKQSYNDALGLMHWKISAGGVVTGANSAADADQDITYALYLAHYQWGSGGTLNYKSLADAEAAKLVAYDLDANRVKPGDSFNDCRYPSYFFPNEYRVFAKEKPATAATWNAVRANCYSTIAAARNPSTGLVPEQVNDSGGPGGCTYISNPNSYYYNSCRVPLRMAMDYVYYGDANAAAQLQRLSSFFGGIAPASVVDCYNTNGSSCGGYNSGAFVGPAATAFMYSGGAALQSYYNYLMADSSYPSRYYDGALVLLSLLLLSGNMPNIADQGAMFTPTPTPTRTNYAGTPTFTPTPTPLAFAWIFEDFENAILVNAYKYAGTGGAGAPSVTYALSNAAANGGTFSDRMVVSMSTTSGDYAGHGFDSSYAPASGVLNFTGATSVRFYVKTDQAVNLRIAFREGAGVAGGDDEVWQSPLLPVPAGANWQVVTANLSTFTENIYNPSCAPNCTSTGNNTFNLSSVKAFEISFNSTLTGANVYIDDIAFVPSVVPTLTPTKTPFPNPYSQIYDDFEAALSLSTVVPRRVTGYANTANGASVAWAKDAGTYVAGAQAARLDYNLGTAPNSYGGGFSFCSPYNTGSFTSPDPNMAGVYYDASGAVQLQLWLKAPAGLKYRLTLQEAGNTATPVSGADGESWYSALLTASGSWERVTVDIGDFVEDPYNPTCNPSGAAAPGPCLTGAQSGNNLPNLNAVYMVGLKLPGEQVGVPSRTGSVYLDDVTFITSYKSPTVTRTYTPGVASPTRTPSPSPTRTPTGTPTRTPTASPTLTATVTIATATLTITSTSSATGTPTGTPSASPTRTATVTIATATLTTTSTSSATRTPTGTPSASPTRTASPSVTPSVSPSFTNVPAGSTATVTPSVTPTFSASPTGTPSRTFTSSVTRTPTPSVTGTNTPAPTGTNTPVSTATNTPTPSASVTVSSTFTLSATPSVSSTGTMTATRTATPPLATATATFVAPSLISLNPPEGSTEGGWVLMVEGTAFQPGAEVLVNGVPLATTYIGPNRLTVLMPAGVSGTATVQVRNPDGLQAATSLSLRLKAPTPTVVPGAPILEAFAFPNPNPLELRVKLGLPADRITVKVYTVGLVFVGEASRPGPLDFGWHRVALPSVPAAGTYFFTVTSERQQGRYTMPGVGRFVRLQ